MPLSRADFPRICELAYNLIRVLESLPDALRALNDRISTGEFDPDTAPRDEWGIFLDTPGHDLEVVRQELLSGLAPSVEDQRFDHAGSEDDIGSANLDLEQKIALKGIFRRCASAREWVKSHSSDREETIRQLLEAIRILQSPGSADADAVPWPEYMTSNDIADRLGQPRDATRKKLERLADRIDCRREVESPRRGEAKWTYRTRTVLPELRR